MKNELTIIRWMMGLIGIISLIGIVGCSEDREMLEGREPETQDTTETLEDAGILEATASAPSYSDVAEASRGTVNSWATDGMTRSTWNPPGSYNIFSANYGLGGPFYQQRDLTNNTIDIYLTRRPDKDPEYLHGRLRKSTGDTWKLSDIEELPTGTYYAYGYIPADAAKGSSISKRAGSSTYADGAVLTIHELKPIVPADVCVTIGAKEGFRKTVEKTDYDGGYYTDSNGNDRYDEGEPNNLDNEETIGDYTPATHKRYNRLTPGDFSVNIKRVKKELVSGDPPNGSNHLFLLFDHIYSGLRFRFKVDTKYDDLRTIVLKKVELKSSDMYEKYDCTITLTADNPTPISSLTFTPTSVTPPETNNYMSYATIFNGALYSTPTPGYPGGIVLQKGTYTDLMGCFLPHETDIFTLKCTYDVYDKQGNRIRQNCTAENELNLDTIFDNLQVVLVRGTYYIVNLTVAPTYLYVLSEPDLDNPTIVVN